MTHPPAGKPDVHVIHSIRGLDKDLIDAAAAAFGLPRGELINRAVAEYAAKHPLFGTRFAKRTTGGDLG